MIDYEVYSLKLMALKKSKGELAVLLASMKVKPDLIDMINLELDNLLKK